MNRTQLTQRIVISALGVAALGLGGCIAALPVAALGVAGDVADIGSTAFTAGTEVFNSGKLESVEFATFDQARAAVRSTLNDLRLNLDQSTATKTKARYDFSDDIHDEVRIDLVQRSPAICGVRIDVGYFGSEAYARLLLKSVRGRLPLFAGRAATQPAQPVDLFKPRIDPAFNRDNLDR
jgi:hypothetical protein